MSRKSSPFCRTMFVVLVIAASCDHSVPPPARTSVNFTVGSVSDPTKTVYGSLVDVPSGGDRVPIQWSEGDTVRIFYPRGEDTTRCDYCVTSLSSGDTVGSIAPLNTGSGLAWDSRSSSALHVFHGLYPAPTADNGGVLADDFFQIEIQQEQYGRTVTESSDTIFVHPSMCSGGWMYATANVQSIDAPVGMLFMPRFSAFTVVVGSGGTPVTVNSFTVKSSKKSMSGIGVFGYDSDDVLDSSANVGVTSVTIKNINRTIDGDQRLVVTAFALPHWYGRDGGDVVTLSFDTNLGRRSLELRKGGLAVEFAPFTRSVIRNLSFPSSGLLLEMEDNIDWDGTIDIFVLENVNWNPGDLSTFVPDWILWRDVDTE